MRVSPCYLPDWTNPQDMHDPHTCGLNFPYLTSKYNMFRMTKATNILLTMKKVHSDAVNVKKKKKKMFRRTLANMLKSTSRVDQYYFMS